MANPEKVVLKIVSVKGTCVAGHYAGQEFDLSKDFLLGLSGRPTGHLSRCFSCHLSLMAGAPTWRRVSLGRGSRQDHHCLPRSIQSRGDGTPKGKRVGHLKEISEKAQKSLITPIRD